MFQSKKQPKLKKTLIKINGISGSVKKFDEKLHSKFDIEARNVLKDLLKDNIIDNPNIYKEDMIFNVKTMKKFPYNFLEVQVCGIWSEDKYPYNYPFVYARKMVFSDDTLFVTFNKFLSKVIIFSKNAIDTKPSKLKKYDRENIHYVGWNKAMLLNSSDLTIENILLYSGVDE
jgi:hypothetical protein